MFNALHFTRLGEALRTSANSVEPRSLALYAFPGLGHFAGFDAGGTNFTDGNSPILHYSDFLEIG